MPPEPGNARDEELAHDVLAAEAFAVPAPDPGLRHGPLVLPDDPSGIAEPHDILAAEEFAMPTGRPASERGRAGTPPKRGIAAVAALGGLFALLRLRRRR